MNIIYSDQPLTVLGPTLFLAVPTPRSQSVESWRPEAVHLLNELAFPGTVLVPERRDWEARFDYLDQVEWEFAALERADALLFWVPRNSDSLPGFTTNVEFGRYVASGRMIYGRPEDRPHNRYLDWLYEKLTGRSPHSTLDDTIRTAVQLAVERSTTVNESGGQGIVRGLP
ncbi:MAG: nucleoside 2-deoxyribosyltransferase domain-containing protein [Planctomycetia bacterium]|nr:nucleoside 2-deoxyribosyltransferase domain-containing protein [Planctomycetia bacterium]